MALLVGLNAFVLGVVVPEWVLYYTQCSVPQKYRGAFFSRLHRLAVLLLAARRGQETRDQQA